MKILSLFDGMACGMIAMLNAGVEVESYDAYEIDKYAIKVSSHNFPNIKHHGDVFKADFTQYEGVDFLVGGSPCTYWSIAQKNNRETEASGLGWELFSQYVRALNEAKPRFFIYENNKSMSKAIRESITETFGFEPICINSALVSAQNRNRLYWVGRRNEDGTYSKVSVDQPDDRGILLKDILESGCDLTTRDKAWTLTASYDGACAWNTIERHQRNMVVEPCCASLIEQPYGRKKMSDGKYDRRFEARTDNKSNALVATHQQQFGMCAVPCEPVRIGCYPSPDGTLKNSQGMRLYSIDGKSVNMTAQGGGLGAKTGLYALPTPMYATPCEWDDSGNPTKATSTADGKVYPVYPVEDGEITIKGKQYPIKLADGFYIIRKLTVRECMRLQTVPEWYDFSVISNAQAYKCLGNGWTCEVITHLINACQTAARRKWLRDLLGGCV